MPDHRIEPFDGEGYHVLAKALMATEAEQHSVLDVEVFWVV